MKILITGCNGMLGQDLVPCLKNAGFEVHCTDIEAMDITKANSVLNNVGSGQPDIVINCAAYTAVDKAESEQDLAFSVNRNGPAHLAGACSNLGIPLLHISTDYVFDGRSGKPYREDDLANPIGVYARSKWEGEEEVRATLGKHIIIRTSWLFGAHGNNFVKTILRLAGERDHLKVINDQKGCPTWTGHLAEALTQIADRMRANVQDTPWGTYHYCGNGATTWFDFAVNIVQNARRLKEVRVSEIVPISTSEYPTPAKRPMNSVLDCSKIRGEFGIAPKPWKEGLVSVLEKLIARSDSREGGEAGRLGRQKA
jgi:dTDP-4-dehydrorhamnose reductase